MRLAFNITRYALLTLVALSLGTWSLRTWNGVHAAGSGDALPADGIVVVNFHSRTRCNSCREIGKQALAVVETDFAAELKSGRIIWQVVNFEEPANKHFVGEYGLTTSTIVVMRRQGGRDAEWQRLDKIWDHLFDGPAMRALVKEHISQVSTP